MAMTSRSILITGCSSGIGLAAARTLKARGWRVLATARKPEDLDRLTTKEGLEALYLELADQASIGHCAEQALSRTAGDLFALFNNAAYGQPGAIEDISADVLRRQIEVNVIGAHELTRCILPAMRANRSGRIVQCSSVLGFVAAPFRGAWSCAAAASTSR
jgi:NAD(P)-dependent dehydrogenase (short-subunit alcohol dehydrogenase family)